MLGRSATLLFVVCVFVPTMASACDQCGSPACRPAAPKCVGALFGPKKPCGCRQTQKCGCDVHVHYIKPCDSCQPKKDRAPATASPSTSAASAANFAPVVQAQAAMGMSMMPMMMPFPMPMMTAFPQMNQQRNQQQTSGCGDCTPRIDRLEKGVEVLAGRMDKIESILENQTLALETISKAVKGLSKE